MNKFMKDLAEILSKKAAEVTEKWNRQQDAIQKNEMYRRKAYLSASLKPHIEAILGQNMFFRDSTHVNISECSYNTARGFWCISIDAMDVPKFKLDSPRVLISLNETVDVYLASLHMEMQEGLQQLSMMAEVGNANPINLELAYSQLKKKYELSNHRIVFTSVKYINEGGATIVRIWIGFK